jgi:glucuronide carrier protein
MTTPSATTTETKRAGRLGLSQYLGYTAGDVANNLTFSLASMFLLLYYTDVAGIAAGAAGTLLFVVRVWQAFTDIVAGRIVDKTTTRWGRFRPYLLFGGPPLMLLSVALFSVPGGLSASGALVYAYVSYALFGLAYSLVNIPFGSLASAMTQQAQERAKLASARTIGAAAAIILLSVVVSPQISRAENLQRSLTITTWILAVAGTALYLFTFRVSRETVERDPTPVSLKQSLRAIRRNRPLVLLCVSALFVLTGMFTLQTLQVYYARDVLGSADYQIVLTVLSIGGMFMVSPVIPRIVEAVGKKRAYVAAGAVTAAGGVGIGLTPPSVLALVFIFFAVYGVGIAASQNLIFALQADTVEYGEWETGARTEGSNYAILSFSRKVGQGIGGAVAAYGIGIGGYVAGSATQSPEALDTIRYLTGWGPALFVAVGAVIMLAYPLTEERFREVVRQIAFRRAERAGTRDQIPGSDA